METILKTRLGKLINARCDKYITEEMEDNSVDLVITSPPYNIGIPYDEYDDKKEPAQYFFEMSVMFDMIRDKMKPDGRLCINVPYEVNMKHSESGGRMFMAGKWWGLLIGLGFKWAGLVDLQEKSPHKSKTTAWGSWLSPSAPYIYNPKECCMILYKDQWKKENKGNSYFSDSQEHKNEFYEYVSGSWKYQAETKWLTQANFSLDIPLKALKILSWENDLVFDPFSGSGTTALACEMLNRRWIATELSSGYCIQSRDRISEYVTSNELLGDLFEL